MKNRFSLSFKAFYFIYLGAVGTFMPYVNVYLEKSVGLNGSQIGLIAALSSVVGFTVIPIWGVVGDKTRKYNALLRVSLAGALVMVALYHKAATYPMIIFCAIGLETMRLGTIPMTDTVTTKYCHESGGNYGAIRAMGSLGYMLASMAVGFLADKFGLDGPIFASYAFLLAIAIPISFTFPKNGNKEEREEDKLQKSSFKELLANKNYIFILCIAILTTVVVDSAMSYAGNHLVSTLHGTKSLISWMTFITVLPEVLFLMVAIKVINKIGFKKYYILVVISMIVRFGVYSFSNNQYAFLAVSVVHCLGVAMVTVGNLTYIRNSVNSAVLGTAITLFNAAMSIGRAIFGYAFGIVYQYGNSYMIYMLGTAAFVVALIILIRTNHFDKLDVKKGHVF
ncbi:MFS transporter [Clostridium folliculivorans]|uniref:Transporter YwbF n=1 Tax=Clostridium folliculivorans TaxID=2886038 RepID=A0A9W5Y299_9CLOT|nr:MFS transporter [Clostridium folliculivorans]GKU25264.1 putative transporter YwbF [Clostridium folliculivorans]GKU28285.1 putative transporter YwbF [Clostridium folliculivorans]